MVGGAAVGVDDAAGVDAVDVGVDAAVDVGEIVVVVAFDADVASEHASSFVVASYAVVVAAVVSVRLLIFYFGGSKYIHNWTYSKKTIVFSVKKHDDESKKSVLNFRKYISEN